MQILHLIRLPHQKMKMQLQMVMVNLMLMLKVQQQLQPVLYPKPKVNRPKMKNVDQYDGIDIGFGKFLH